MHSVGASSEDIRYVTSPVVWTQSTDLLQSSIQACSVHELLAEVVIRDLHSSCVLVLVDTDRCWQVLISLPSIIAYLQ
jgi:hypothetical protein